VNSLRSAVASILRLMAVGVLLLGVLFLVLAYAASRQEEPSIGRTLIGVAGFLSGIGLLVFSAPIARALTRDYE
jgi:hypothetical protein